MEKGIGTGVKNVLAKLLEGNKYADEYVEAFPENCFVHGKVCEDEIRIKVVGEYSFKFYVKHYSLDGTPLNQTTA